MKTVRRLLVATALAFTPALAIGASAAHAKSAAVMIVQAWAPATPPGAPTAAVYLTINNHGAAPDTLTGGTSPVAGSVQVHQMSMANGIMRMRQMQGGLPIPAGGTVTMEPSKPYHLMLIGLKHSLTRGSVFPMTLDFAKAGPVQVAVSVAALGARSPDTADDPPHHH